MPEKRRPATGAFLALSLSLVSVPGGPTPAKGEVFQVTSEDDLADLDPFDRACRVNLVGGAVCTLRAAVQQANALPGMDEIVLPAGSFPLVLAGNGEDQSLTGDLDVTDDLLLRGAGAELTVVSGMAGGSDPDRVLDLVPLCCTMQVTLRDLTIRNGRAATGHGIRNDGATLELRRVTLRENGGDFSGAGGALANLSGAATLHQVRIEDNQNVCPQNSLCFGDDAAGIYNQGLLTILDSLVARNDGFSAGGLRNVSPGVVGVQNSTFSANSSQTGPGGIHNAFGLSLVHVTMALDDGSWIHDLFTESGAVSTVRASILTSGSYGFRCGGPGTVLSAGFNLEAGTSCGFDDPTDLVGISPQLLPLADRGGPTPTHGLYFESPAIDAGGLCTAMSGAPLEQDQRGSRRPVDGNGDGIAFCDIGAYEWLPSAIFADDFESGDLASWSGGSP